MATYAAAIALAGVAAFFSIGGVLLLFPGILAVVGMRVAMEAANLAT
jgi:hypothetical protein